MSDPHHRGPRPTPPSLRSLRQGTSRTGGRHRSDGTGGSPWPRIRVALVGLAVVTGLVAVPTLRPDPVTVAVTVDGVQQTVTSAGDTVADLLAEAGVVVASGDVVEPGPGTELRAGLEVAVVHARPVRLVVDGGQVTRTVAANTVGEALEVLSLDERGTYVSRSADARIPLTGLHAVVRTPQRVRVVTAAGTDTVTTTAPTVAALLAQVEVAVDDNDQVTPALGTYPTDGATVRVVDVRVRRTVVRSPLPAPVVRRTTSDLEQGVVEVRRPGRAGLLRVTRSRVTHDGRVVSTKVVDRKVRSPRPRVLLVGTGVPRDAGPGDGFDVSASVTSSLDWEALAMCESSGNPTVVSANGLYYGLYQFSLPTWRSVGGSGLPSEASPAEQTMRAQLLYDRAGPGQWPVCGSRL